MMHEDTSGIAIRPQLLPMQRLADARRVLEINLDDNIFAKPEDRQALRQAKRVAWAVLGEVCEELVETMNVVAGDPDIELNGDENDSDGDERGDTAWIEWNTMRGSQKSGHNLLAGEEDAEDDEGGGDHGGDEGEPDFAKRAGGYGAGCKISDDDFEHDGCEEEGR